MKTRSNRFEYWRELVLVLVMLSVLVVDLTLFENMWTFGEDDSQTTVSVMKGN